MKIFSIITLLLSLILFSATILAAETIRFTTIDYCPLTCDPTKDDGKEGIMTDVVRAAFEEAGYKIELEIMPYARAVKAVTDGKYDGVVVVGKNYAPTLIYPQNNTITQRMMFMVKPTNHWRYTGYQSLLSVNATMTITKGFDYGDNDINHFVASKPTNLVSLNGSKTAQRGFELLQLERVDTYLEGDLIALYNIAKYGYTHNFIVAGFSTRVFEDYTAFNPHSPNAVKYAKILSNKISQLQKSGEFKNILAKYGVTKKLNLGNLIGKNK
ncbi:transporter substrate-binding domain-containing protein [Psychromonas sp. MME2]|uniref:substrate-binding periplasmic protein n=1 Tax=unclassified Psychromonas TaxID=2614957 RepID=UPI00339C0B3B